MQAEDSGRGERPDRNRAAGVDGDLSGVDSVNIFCKAVANSRKPVIIRDGMGQEYNMTIKSLGRDAR